MQTSGRIPQEDVFGVLLAILEVHGVTAVRSGNLYKIVPVEGARERAVPTIVGGTADPSAHRPTRSSRRSSRSGSRGVNDLGTLLRPLISSRGHADRQPRDGRPHHHRLGVQHRAACSTSSGWSTSRWRSTSCRSSRCSTPTPREMATILNQLFQAGRLRAGRASGARPRPRPPARCRRPWPGAPPGAGRRGGAVGGGSDRPPLIVPERRSNSLIVHARKGEMETIRRVIDKIDVNI